MTDELKKAVADLVAAARKAGVKEQVVMLEIREAWLASVSAATQKPVPQASINGTTDK